MSERIVLFFLILILNIVDSIFILRYHKHLYSAIRWEKRKFTIVFALVIILATVVFSIIPAMILWGMVLFSSLWLGAYQGGKKNKALFQLVLISLSVLSFLLSFMIAISFFKSEMLIGVCTLLFSHVLFAAMVEATRRFNQSVLIDLPGKMWLVLFSIPVASLICLPAFSRMVALNEEIASDIGKNQVVILLAIFFINIMVFYLFRKFSELLHTRIETAVLQQQIEMQEKYYLAIEENQAKVRVLQHDMRNQLNTITAMFEDGDMINLGRYLKQMEGSVDHVKKLIVTGNSPIDTILNIKISELNGCGVQIKSYILLPKGVKLPFREAAILFGNLLDNVLEECNRLPLEKREVKIQLSYTNHIMLLKITNPMATAEKKLPLESKKDNPKAHGLGLKSVQQIVDQFNGTIKITAQNHMFQISIVLYDV